MAAKSFQTICRICVEQSDEHFHAHVELDDDIAIYPGDQVQVHGQAVQISFGESITIERTATVTRAGPLLRGWTKLASYFDFKELYEVSFTAGSLK